VVRCRALALEEQSQVHIVKRKSAKNLNLALIGWKEDAIVVFHSHVGEVPVASEENSYWDQGIDLQVAGHL
jgi:proteasome lid subunit RPN8/RPN11